MNPFKAVIRHPVRTLMVVVALIGGVAYGLHKTRVNVPGVNNPRFYATLDGLFERGEHLKGQAVAKYESYFHKKEAEGEAEAHHEGHKVVATSPMSQNVIITQDYVCQIHSQRHINIQALESGYLEAIPIKEGQSVKRGDLMFKIIPILFQARLEAEIAEVELAQLEYNNTKRLYDDKTRAVSQNEVLLFKAKLAKAEAKRKLAEAELNFATVRAPFDGIVDRLVEQQGSLVKEGDSLTTLSDNSVMWVYFNVPEKRYLEYMAELGQNKEIADIELRLANQNKFPELGKIDPAHNIGAIEAKFNNETGNIAFRADFLNPTGLLRQGQTGKVVISRALANAIVIPQRATFETLAKRYVYVIGKDDVVHQREIEIQNELEDIYVIEKGLEVGEKIVYEGIRQVRDGEKVEYEFRNPEDIIKNQKNHAE